MNQFKMSSLKRIIRGFLLEGENEKALVPMEVFIFKQLQEKKEELKTKDGIIEFLKKLLGYMGISKDEALYYYYLFSLNYRPDGNYKDLKKSELKSLADLKASKTTNVSSGVYTASKIPFYGSNLQGFWEKDSNGVSQYVVTSYNWYPILLWKDGMWYAVSDSYSRATGRQMSQSGRNVFGGNKVTRLSTDEIRRLRTGQNFGELKNRKLTELYKDVESLIGKKFFMTEYIQNDFTSRTRFKFYIDSIDMENEKIDVNVKIENADAINHNNEIVARNINTNQLDNEKVKYYLVWKIRSKNDLWKKVPNRETINIKDVEYVQ